MTPPSTGRRKKGAPSGQVLTPTPGFRTVAFKLTGACCTESDRQLAARTLAHVVCPQSKAPSPMWCCVPPAWMRTNCL